jgi:uncharacterized protein
MKVWIDLSNSPHPLIFAPVVRHLSADGHDAFITARDNAQTVELAQERWPEIDVIGAESPRKRTAKLGTFTQRVEMLRRRAATAKPDVALSHNSYAQIVAARRLRIPVVTAMDFEFQPANHLAFRLATTVLLPEVIPVRAVQGQGADPRKVVRYPGLKEELYVGDFAPDPRILSKVGIEARPTTVAVVRTPPTRAIYHASANPLFEGVLRTICDQKDIACVVLTRHREQIEAIGALGLPNCIVPIAAIDSRSLMYAADVMIGAGGTMTREAALMGIPTWTMFAGTVPAVDAWLERAGKLRRLVAPEQLSRLGPRPAPPRSLSEMRARSEAIEQAFFDATLAAGTWSRARPRVPARA